MGQKSSKKSYAIQQNDQFEVLPSIHKGGIVDVASSSDGYIATCGDDKSIALIKTQECISDYKSLEPAYLQGHQRAVNKICLRHEYIFSISRDLSIRIWNRNTCEQLNVVENAHSLNIAAIAALKDGTRFATGSRDYSVKVWDTATCTAVREYAAPRNVVTCMQYGASESFLYQGSEDLCLRVYDLRSTHKNASSQLQGYVYFPISIDIHENGHYLATG
jgi:WD40 repeat protein